MTELKNKMTVSEGLAKLKLIDKRIMKSIQGSFVGYKVGNKVMDNFDSEKAKSKLDSVNSLIEYKSKVKMAINKSNLTTVVKIAGVEMTVLEAIENKNIVEYKKAFLNALRRNLGNVNSVVEAGNEEVNERLDSQVRSAFEKSNHKEIEAFTKAFLENNGYKLEDPLDITSLVEKLDKEIDDFESEVDFVLSTSNATTVIEI